MSGHLLPRPSAGPALPAAAWPAALPGPLLCDPLQFSRGFCSWWGDRGLGWVGVAEAERACPCGLCSLLTLSPSLPACVGPDGFPKFVSDSAPFAQAERERECPPCQGSRLHLGSPAVGLVWGAQGHRVSLLHGLPRTWRLEGRLRAELAKLSAGAWPAARCSLSEQGPVQGPSGTPTWSVPAWTAVGQQLPGLCVRRGLRVGAVCPGAVQASGLACGVRLAWLRTRDQAPGPQPLLPRDAVR